jgi:hypothetical protein
MGIDTVEEWIREEEERNRRGRGIEWIGMEKNGKGNFKMWITCG